MGGWVGELGVRVGEWVGGWGTCEESSAGSGRLREPPLLVEEEERAAAADCLVRMGLARARERARGFSLRHIVRGTDGLSGGGSNEYV